MDDFLKNVGSSSEYIRFQTNVMGDETVSEMEWNEPFFRDCFDNITEIVTWVSRKQKVDRFQMITQQLNKEKKIRCVTVVMKSVETRFLSRHGMTERGMNQKVYKDLVKDELFLEWLRKHPKPIR